MAQVENPDVVTYFNVDNNRVIEIRSNDHVVFIGLLGQVYVNSSDNITTASITAIESK